ncbi:MAG: LamG domain-containing protein [Candidatus Poribacteria bacterium]|nr:LamG domain-containing protein [Candidatus Poribacteria bacterium]
MDNRFFVPILSLVVTFVLATSPHALAKIDPDTVVGMWLFEEGVGDVAKDTSKSGNDGTIAGPKKWRDGKFGQALEFNGNDVYVEVESNKSITLEELTIVAWANLEPSQGARWQSIMMRGQNPRNYLLAVDKDSQTLQFSLTKGAPGAWGGPIGGPVVTGDGWHHLAGVVGEKAGLVIYADGEEVGKQAYAKPSLDADPGRMRIGDGSNGGHQCEGLLDEVALFNVPLEQDDIKTIMNDGLERATGLLAVEPENKLTTIWGKLKSGL